MKETLTLITTCALTLCSLAYEEWTDPKTGITWAYTVSEGNAVIGHGNGFSGSAIPTSTQGVLEIPSIVNGKPVSSIAHWAFDACSGLTSVSIPDGVKSIGWESFRGCSMLAHISIPSSVSCIGRDAFCGSPLLGSGIVIVDNCVLHVDDSCPDCVKLPLGTRLMADGVFSYCELTNIEIPSSMTCFGGETFLGCVALTNVTVSEGVGSIGESAFRKCRGLTSVTIPASVTNIDNEAFYDCSGLTNVTISEGVKTIGNYAFYGCTNIEEIVVPKSVLSIGIHAFDGCTRLRSITIPFVGEERHSGNSKFDYVFGDDDYANRSALPESLETVIVTDDDIIGEFAFCGASGIKKVVLPTNVTSIGWCAFTYCSELNDFNLPPGLVTIGYRAFCECSKLTSVTIPPTVTSIGKQAFYMCNGLTSVIIPPNVTKIEEETFSNCIGLKSAIISDGVGSIGRKAFYECSSLTNVTISSSVTNIGNYAFANCESLEGLVIPSSVTVIGINAFSEGNLKAIDFEGAPPSGAGKASIKTDTAIRYNAKYEVEWSSVIESCGWTNAKPYNPLECRITSVTAQQRYPWNGLVDIVVTIRGSADEIGDCIFVATNCETQTAVNIVTLNQVGTDAITNGVCTRYYIWNLTNDVGNVKIENLALIVGVQKRLGGVQLWKDGPYWDECNVGATNPEEDGYYFWWGDTVGYKRNADNIGWVSVKDGSAFVFCDSNCPTFDKSNSTLLSLGYIDSTGNVVATNDAATAHLGAPWRMPTDAEFSELISKCETTWVCQNGAYGRLVTGKGLYASKSIFLPAAGYSEEHGLYDNDSYGHYWSSTPSSGFSRTALSIGFYSAEFYPRSSKRYRGQSIRPVRDTATVVANATLHISIDCREIPALGENPTMDEITNVFIEAKAEDPNLAQKITNETEYVAFREWSGKVKPQGGSEPAGAAGVMAAPNAWLSYALGSETLIESVPTNGQMRIVSFEPNTNSTASAGRFDFTIRIDDIPVGDDAKTNNLAQIFGLEGGTSLEPGGMSSTNVDITFGAPQDGKVKFTAGPRDANTKTFFMKVKMTP